jgi:hypothetical protein
VVGETTFFKIECGSIKICIMDERHLTFLKRNGVDAYNNYFNRDKRTIVQKGDDHLVNYDPFIYEYREGDNAVPRPPENKKIAEEPDPSDYKNVPLEYICEHGILEFILESEYPYCLNTLFHYSKPSEYQMDYLKKLIKEGRLTKKVFRL